MRVTKANETMRIKGSARPLVPLSRKRASADDDAVVAARWNFLADFGIEGLLAHWMMTNLTDAQFESMRNAVSRTGQRSVEAAARGRHGLTARELEKCRARGVDPAKYATMKRGSR